MTTTRSTQVFPADMRVRFNSAYSAGSEWYPLGAPAIEALNNHPNLVRLQAERDALLALVRRLLLNPDLPIEGTLKYHDARALLQQIEGAK